MVAPEVSCDASSRASLRAWSAVVAVGLSTFCVVTTEMLPVGLLTPIAASLGMSAGIGALTIFVPAVLAAVFAPVVTVGSRGINRRFILCGLLALLVCANIASALAPTMSWFLAARVLVGFCMGGIWAIAGGLAPRLVGNNAVGPATAVIFGGVAAASVLGVPFGAFIGYAAGWRVAFGAMAALSGFVLIANLMLLPSLPVANSVSIRQLASQVANARVRLGLLTTLFIVAGHFMAFTFVRPLLQTHAGFDEVWVGPLLFGYGLAGISGNFVAGIAAARQVGWTLLSIAICLALTLLVFQLSDRAPTSAMLVLLAWGGGYGGVSVSLQAWMMKAAPRSVEAATAVYVAVFNLGIASGSLVGGVIVDAYGLRSNLLIAGGSMAVAVLLAIRAQIEVTRMKAA